MIIIIIINITIISKISFFFTNRDGFLEIKSVHIKIM